MSDAAARPAAADRGNLAHRAAVGSSLAAIFAMLIAAGGCVETLAPPILVEPDRQWLLDGREVTAHLANPGAPHNRPLLLYATGDGGWGGRDLDTFDELVSFGYPTAGFSSPEYLDHLPNNAKTTTPTLLAHDYLAMIDSARFWLSLPPETMVILVGVSRGADLAVAAAGQPVLRHQLGGVVAVGLTREEEYVLGDERNALALYEYLPNLSNIPISVIQSTHDEYLTADAARTLFGPDGPRRQLHAIASRDHSFSDARAPLYDAVGSSLEWIEAIDSSPSPR